MEYEAQATHQNTSSLQVESSTKRTWRPTGLWSKLLGNIRPSSYLGIHSTRTDHVNPTQMEDQTDRFCARVPTGRRGNGDVHECTKGLPNETYGQQDLTCFKTTQEPLRTKASRMCMASIHPQNTFGARVLTQLSGQMRLLPR